jgi:predicted PhzF superfamily epimerase YddE/YHI9
MTRIALVDAFATRPFEGNQAAVVLLDAPAETIWMQALAGELGYGATCFLHGRDLRWFSPSVELSLCGHGTLATAHLLWERGATEEELAFATAAGPLVARRRTPQVEIDLPAQPTRPAVVPGLAGALGVVPVAVGRAPLDLVAELDSADAVRTLAPDLAAVAQIDARGVIVTAAGDDGEHAIVSRFFAPAMGIPEDSATGSAHCALASWWAPRLGDAFRARQASPRGATIDVEGTGDRVRLRAGAVTVLSGEL